MRLLVIALGLSLLIATALAQEAPAEGDAARTAASLQDLSPQERVDLIAKLDDSQARDLLLFYLAQSGPAAAPEAGEAGFLDYLESRAELVRENAVAALKSADEIPDALVAAHAKLSAGSGAVGYLWIAAALAVLIAAGAAAEWLYLRLAGRLREALRVEAVRGGPAWLRSTFGVLFLDIMGLVVFAAGYVAAFLAMWQGNAARRHLAAAVLIVILVVRGARCFGRALLAPENIGNRLIPLDGAGARYFQRGLERIALLGAVSIAAAKLFGVWSENTPLETLLLSVSAALTVGYSIFVVWGGRAHAAHAFLAPGEDGEPAYWPMRAVAYVWAPAVIVYLLAVLVIATFSRLAGTPIGIGRPVAALLFMIAVVPVLDRLVGFLLARRNSANALDPTAPKGHQNRVIRRAARILIVVLAVASVFNVFGLTGLAEEQFGGRLVKLVFDIGIVVLVAYVLWEVTLTAINRRLALETPADADHDAGAGAPNSRLRTILPLLRRMMQAAIVTIAALMILSALGVNIGPLLAGAGVVGLAVGFGAQTLVKDLISGLFFLLDDAFRVGEYIEVAGFGGAVERINTRSLSLRTPAGGIHTIPFGGIDAVANHSRDWAIVKMEFRVTYDTDIAKVKKIFRRIGEDLMKDPELAPGFLQPFKYQGVKAMEETGILLRGKFMAVPGTQFQIRKQVFERVQKAFSEEGIKFAQRRVQVDLPPGFEADEAARTSLTNAAAAAIAAETPAAQN
jgi:small-conductance mechanosensitive channel